MNKSTTEFPSQEIENDEIEQKLKEFDRLYQNLRNKISYEFSDYEDELKRARNQANSYKNKVQTREVLKEILPILSDIFNEVLDSHDLDELKKYIIDISRKQLEKAFKGVGVTVQMHNRGDIIPQSEELNVSAQPIKTSNRDDDQRVARSTRMGCIIRGEENSPILEEILIYEYEEQPINGQFIGNEIHKDIYEKNAMPSSPKVMEVYDDINKDTRRAQNMCGKPNVELQNDQYIKFLTKIKIVSTTDNKKIFTFPENDRKIDVNFNNKIEVMEDFKDLDKCSIYLGNDVLLHCFSLKNVKLYCRIDYDTVNSSTILKLINGNTDEVISERELNVKSIKNEE